MNLDTNRSTRGKKRLHKKQKVWRLWRFVEIEGKCEYCGTMMRMPETGEIASKDQPDNTATVDHLYSKGHPLRNTKQQRLVLVCRKCNHDKGMLERDGKFNEITYDTSKGTKVGKTV